MNEKEMEKTWCPKFQDPFRDNRYSHESSRCIGSECAMWEPLINDCGLKATAQEKLHYLLADSAVRTAVLKDLKDAIIK